MEIEKKYLTDNSFDYTIFPHKKLIQGYLSTNPVVRVRKEDENYYLTYKGKGMMVREEYNLALTAEAFDHLIQKADGNIISKTRYLIQYGKHTIELDVFDEPFAPLIMAEVEFDSVDEAEAFIPPSWFTKEVTNDPAYQNSNMSKKIFK